MGLNTTGTASKLEINGKSYFGQSGETKAWDDKPFSLNKQTATHAETDPLEQAYIDGQRGGSAELTVDRSLCGARDKNAFYDAVNKLDLD